MARDLWVGARHLQASAPRSAAWRCSRSAAVPAAVLMELDRLSRRIYRALGLSGYARMDFRVSAAGQVYVLEANANPNLEIAEDFAESARAAGTPYGELLERLVDLGLKYRAQWRATYG